MEILIRLLGSNGIVVVIGVMIFFISFKYSVEIFDWIERQTFGTREYIMEKLEILQRDIPPEKITYLLLGCSIGFGFFILLIFGLMGKWFLGLFLAGIGSFIGFKIPRPFIDKMVARRINDYSLQMVDALQLLANGIRAGLSVPQALSMVVSELHPPISDEFNLVLQQNKIGVTLEESFEALAKRMPTEDNDMFVSSITILKETGGNLSEVFDTIVDVIRERIRLKQKIDTYIAQGKTQAYILFSMPFVIGGLYGANDPDSIKLMFSHPLGYVALFVVLFLDCFGLFVILKIVDIKV